MFPWIGRLLMITACMMWSFFCVKRPTETVKCTLDLMVQFMPHNITLSENHTSMKKVIVLSPGRLRSWIWVSSKIWRWPSDLYCLFKGKKSGTTRRCLSSWIYLNSWKQLNLFRDQWNSEAETLSCHTGVKVLRTQGPHMAHCVFDYLHFPMNSEKRFEVTRLHKQHQILDQRSVSLWPQLRGRV